MPDFLLSEISISPRFAELLAKRGITEPAEIRALLQSSLEDLNPPENIKGLAEAVERIQKAVKDKEKIMLHGDYDVDGVTSTAILARTLQALGADFHAFLPERDRDGYGVNMDAIREGARRGVTLILTADCGINAHKQILFAREFGIDVIIIDHHRIPSNGLPPAFAILNPLQKECGYPYKELSAGGLAFKLSQALLGAKAFELLDLAALSTVADVAPLTGENRIIVKHGLKRLSERTNAGVRALAHVSKIRAREMNVGHIGFMLAPRINAAGRMSSPATALQLLLTEHEREAESLANILNEENKLRQREERQIVKEAIAMAERTFNFKRDRVIVVSKTGWHAGIIGIVAARLVDRFHRPAIVIAVAEGKGKGSGRSIKAFHLFEAMSACKDLFVEFGGHAQAAGLVMDEKNIPLLRDQMNEYARTRFLDEDFEKKVRVDMELSLTDLRSPFVRELQLLEPYGAGNPRPVFKTQGLKLKGKPRQLSPQTVQLWLTDEQVSVEASLSNFEDSLAWLTDFPAFDVAYGVKIKKWDGMESLVLDIKDIRPSS